MQEHTYNTNDSYKLIIFSDSLLKTLKSVLDSRVTGSPKNTNSWKCTLAQAIQDIDEFDRFGEM